MGKSLNLSVSPVCEARKNNLLLPLFCMNLTGNLKTAFFKIEKFSGNNININAIGIKSEINHGSVA